jgi:Asp-tRNA(Asn)/Glu-tRNA(Gln) amidotransferase A subunit family amidase
LPVGLSFFGAAFSEPTLLRLASGFEHAAGGNLKSLGTAVHLGGPI